jgi:hypothetical protein
MEPAVSKEERIGLMAIGSTPALRHVEGDVVQRNWIVRAAEAYSQDLGECAGMVEAAVAEFIRDEFSDDYSPEDLADCLLRLELISVDDRHLIVRTRMAARDPGGPARVAAEYELLRRVDNIFHIEALQGFPRRFWPLIFGR